MEKTKQRCSSTGGRFSIWHARNYSRTREVILGVWRIICFRRERSERRAIAGDELLELEGRIGYNLLSVLGYGRCK